MAEITLTVDGRRLTAEQGKSILEVCLENGIYIPHLCHHNALHPIGACRLCVVEIEGCDGLATSCTEAAEDGMAVRTKGGEIDRTRRLSMELMLSGHQADCGTCTKYLNCELQSLKQYLVADELRVRRRSRLFGATDTNPIFFQEPNKCVLCGRCVRACHELRGVGILFYKQSHGETYIGIGPDPNRDIPLGEAGCRFCGACAEVCPTGAILDRDEFGSGKSRKAALLPCAGTCPAEIDVPRYLRFIREGNYAAAAAVVREKAPFPGVLGYVCGHPCESVCRRGQVSEPVSICRLKRFAAENDTEQLWARNILKKPETGRRVAVIGAGPAGLSAAYFLTLLGHAAVVFEAMPEPGGMLRYGIPEYRLPLPVLEAEIGDIVGLGVDIRTNTRIESIDALFEKGFNAVLIAVGAQEGVRLKIPGAKGEGVFASTEFLRAVRLGEDVTLGGTVLVLGGGNVAFDCARTARRLGAGGVMLACLEPREAMLASPEEIREGEEEGIRVFPSRTFKRIVREEGRVTGVEFLNVLSFTFDEDKRLQLETAEDSAHVVAADTVIFAVGQRAAVPEGFGVDLTTGGFVEAEPSAMTTSREGVFAAADAVTGTDKVISAVAAGRRAAAVIDRFLGGRGRLDVKLAPDAPPETRLGKLDGFAGLVRAPERRVPPEARIDCFCAADPGFDAEEAGLEAKRCLQCDLRLAMKPEKFWSSY
jgi:NADPH-dependent glutamate synthase beta subunit-like oxidoreductase/ferredoxin